MKKFILTTITVLSFTFGVSQTTFKIEIIDSVQKTKNQIYSDTKVFIAETWKSSKNVIQNDDKDAGNIFIEGSVQKIGGSGIRTATFWYSYSVKFYMKEQKFKVVIENLQFKTSDKPGWTAEVADTWPGGMKCSISEKSWTELMISLKADMQRIIDDYSLFIKSPNNTKNDW